MSSDPHPQHTACPEMNGVGFIQPGQTKSTNAFRTLRTCGFHDHNQPSTVALQGSIVIQSRVRDKADLKVGSYVLRPGHVSVPRHA